MADLSITQQIVTGKGKNTIHWWNHQKVLLKARRKKGNLQNLQNEGSEDNIYNYIIKNVTQPLEIIIENSVVEDLSQDRACSIDIDQSNFVTQCEKFSNENTRIPIDTTCESEIPLAEFQSPSLETTITTEIPTVGNIEQSIAIAPGEGKKPISILNDIYCEEMAHPHLFPTGKFG